jgi:DNA polymerase-3 subunit beta
MKVTFTRKGFLQAFSTVSSVIPSKTHQDILRNVKLCSEGGRVTLLATDTIIGIRSEVDSVVVDSDGEVLLPADTVGAIFRKAQDDSVVLETERERLCVRTSHSEFRLSVGDPEEFPSVAIFDDDDYWIVSGRQLKQTIQRTVFATDVERPSYALGGVLVEASATSMVLAATDSRRLAVAQAPCSRRGEPSAGQRPVVPSKAMQLIERSIHDEEQEVHLAFHPNDVLVRSGTSTIYARLVEGRYPEYQDVIPRDLSVSIDLKAGSFLRAVQEAMIVMSDDLDGARFAFQDGKLTITSVGAGVGRSEVYLPVSYNGEPVTLKLNPRFLEEYLQSLDQSARVALGIVNSRRPVVFHADGGYTYVVMPMVADEDEDECE